MLGILVMNLNTDKMIRLDKGGYMAASFETENVIHRGECH